MISGKIIYTYVAFLKNYDRVSHAIEKYYTELTGVTKIKLLQEIALVQKGSLAERVMKADIVVGKILDLYNSIQPIKNEDISIDIDLDDEIEKLLLHINQTNITNNNNNTKIITRIK